MEDAANILGAGTWRTMRRVTLPLVLPAILGGLIICFLETIALFGSPAMIAIPARFNVVTTQLCQFFGNPVRVEVAAAYAMPLLASRSLLILVQRLITRRKGFVALTGKGGERRPIRLGPLALGDVRLCLFVASLAVFLPYIVLVQAAFAKAWGRGFSLDNLTLRNFHFVLFEHATAAQVGDQQLPLCRRQRHGGGARRPGRRLHRGAPAGAVRRACWASSAWRPSSSRASSWRSASTPPMRRRRSRSTARR